MWRVVTIDGPAGAGKSTVARQLADRLGWRLLDTGAMYRAVALAAKRSGVDITSEPQLEELAHRISVSMPPGRINLNGEDVTGLLRTPEISRDTRLVADSPAVRNRLVAWQREFAASSNTVTEGRDQGTIVFPDAFRKFFLTASLEERARRRAAEYAAKGNAISLDEVLGDMIERDARDEARAIAPLKAADDARNLDTTGLDLAEVVEILLGSILSVGS